VKWEGDDPWWTWAVAILISDSVPRDGRDGNARCQAANPYRVSAEATGGEREIGFVVDAVERCNDTPVIWSTTGPLDDRFPEVGDVDAKRLRLR
jgi:hypothetical protein